MLRARAVRGGRVRAERARDLVEQRAHLVALLLLVEPDAVHLRGRAVQQVRRAQLKLERAEQVFHGVLRGEPVQHDELERGRGVPSHHEQRALDVFARPRLLVEVEPVQRDVAGGAQNLHHARVRLLQHLERRQILRVLRNQGFLLFRGSHDDRRRPPPFAYRLRRARVLLTPALSSDRRELVPCALVGGAGARVCASENASQSRSRRVSAPRTRSFTTQSAAAASGRATCDEKAEKSAPRLLAFP